jgi:hypothetical protein
MKCGARVAIGVAGGYFLGRTKKMKLALMLGGMAAGRQAGGPGQLLGQGAKLLGSSPELAALRDQLTGRLVDAGKDAVMAVAARQIGSLTDRVSDRVESFADPERLSAVRPRRKGRRAAEDADDAEPEETDAEDEAVADTEAPGGEAADSEVDGAPDDGADTDEETERAPAKSGARSRSASANSSRNRTSTRSSSSSGRTSTGSKTASTGNATPKRRAAGAAATRTVGAARSGAKSATSRASRGNRSER